MAYMDIESEAKVVKTLNTRELALRLEEDRLRGDQQRREACQEAKMARAYQYSLLGIRPQSS